jgi:hypothetical protein
MGDAMTREEAHERELDGQMTVWVESHWLPTPMQRTRAGIWRIVSDSGFWAIVALAAIQFVVRHFEAPDFNPF